jgi:hypothetical protein
MAGDVASGFEVVARDDTVDAFGTEHALGEHRVEGPAGDTLRDQRQRIEVRVERDDWWRR